MVIEGRWRYRFRSVSFGQTNDKEPFYKELFDVVYHGRVTFQDAYNMPVNLRAWWIKRINWTMEEQRKAEEKAHREAERTNRK